MVFRARGFRGARKGEDGGVPKKQNWLLPALDRRSHMLRLPEVAQGWGACLVHTGQTLGSIPQTEKNHTSGKKKCEVR